MLLTTACDPCVSVTGCTGNGQFTITGRILQEENQLPAVGASVDFIRTGGIVLDADSARTFTSAEGVFTLRIAGHGTGLITGEIVVRSAPDAALPFGYRILDQTLRVFPDVGDANVFPVWSTRPTFPDLGMLVHPGVPPGELEGIDIEFRRTGGIAISSGEVFRTVTGGGGVFPLFDRIVRPADAGAVVGDLHIGFNNVVIHDVRITATPEFRRNAGIYFIDVAP